MLFEKKFLIFFFTQVCENTDHYKCGAATVVKLDILNQMYFRLLNNSSVWSTKSVDDLLYLVDSKNGFKRSFKPVSSLSIFLE